MGVLQEEENTLPQWSEKVSHGILTGDAAPPRPDLPTFCSQRPSKPESNLLGHLWFCICTGASWLSWGLVKGAEYTEKAIHKGASKLREHITPEDAPASVARGFQVAKQATGGAVKVSQYLGKKRLLQPWMGVWVVVSDSVK